MINDPSDQQAAFCTNCTDKCFQILGTFSLVCQINHTKDSMINEMRGCYVQIQFADGIINHLLFESCVSS